MSVSGIRVAEYYTGDGFTQDFAYPNYFLNPADLVVQLTPTDGTLPVTKTYITDYTVSGVADSFGAFPSGGSVHFLVAPGAGVVVTISRNSGKLQSTHYVDQDTFPATTHEHALDKLTLIVQEVLVGLKGIAAGPPSSGAFAVGDWIIAFPPVPGGPFGYVCTAAGSPGTWYPFGGIST